MRIGSTIFIALRALMRNKMRSILTSLGIIFGIAAVITTVSIGNGAKTQMEETIAAMGDNVLIVLAGNYSSGGRSSGSGGAGTLTLADAESIGKEIEGIKRLSPEARGDARATVGNQNWFTKVTGVLPGYFELRSWPFSEGEGFSDRDVSAAAKVAVIGATVARELFGQDSPVGQIVRIKGVPFLITGVLSGKGANLFGQDQDDAIFMPLTSATKRILGNTRLRSIQVQAAYKTDIPAIQDQIIQLLNQRHRITSDKEADFMVRTQEDIAQMATANSKIMTLLLSIIASVSLLVGGIGIMNIMLVSVTERTREIGIRLAVGAHGRDILLQFVLEAITLSTLGGLLGILLGVSLSELFSSVVGWNVLISTQAILISFSVSAVIGIFFGFYPAMKAAQLDPIDALRHE